MMENKKNLSTGVIVLLTTLVIAVIGLVSFIVYDKVIKNEEVKEPTKNEENKPSNEVEREEINVKFDENHMFYVNDNKVDFYNESDYKHYMENESEFYYKIDTAISYNYKVMDDVVFVGISIPYMLNGEEFYFIDKTGKVIKKIGGANSDIELSASTSLIQIENKDDNSVTLKVKADHYQDFMAPYCQFLKEGKTQEPAYYFDKIIYLGNGEFKVDKAVNITTYEELAKKWATDNNEDLNTICS